VCVCVLSVEFVERECVCVCVRACVLSGEFVERERESVCVCVCLTAVRTCSAPVRGVAHVANFYGE